MEPKKQPLRYLNDYSGLYFLIALILLLAVIYVALEWKTPFGDGGYDIGEPQVKKDSSVILSTKAIKQDSSTYKP